MKIQAINSIQSCQPIKQVGFAKKAKKPVIIENPANGKDSFTSNQTTTEQKYDLACRIAAYYKTQYENLLLNGYCEA